MNIKTFVDIIKLFLYIEKKFLLVCQRLKNLISIFLNYLLLIFWLKIS